MWSVRTGCAAAVLLVMAAMAGAAPPVDKWVTITGRAAGTGERAVEDATAQALRVAVEEACGVFLTAQSKSEDYKAVYDKVFANAVGYVREHKLLRTSVVDGVTEVTVQARVSTRKFEEDWAVIAHTVNQENNPRVILVLTESVHHGPWGPTYEQSENSIVQGQIEDFFLQKGITLMDRDTASDVAKRDVLLAVIKDDIDAVASLGARFHADVVVTGQASVKFSKELPIAGQVMYQYSGTLNVRVIQSDSARVLVSKSFGPMTVNTLQRGGGEDKVLSKISEDVAPQLLAAVVEAWRTRANIQRTIQLGIAGMDYEAWRAFKAQVEPMDGVLALRLREITEGLATIDVEYRYSTESLADRLIDAKTLPLKVQEITANRLTLQWAPQAPADALPQ